MPDSNYSHILFEITDSVAIIKLNRPEVLNSLNGQMLKELFNAISSIEEDESVRALLITGEGNAFCAGQDLSEAVKLLKSSDTKIEDIVEEYYNPLIKLIREIPKPVICGVNGAAVGAGAGIASGCDIVLASEEAYFSFAFSKIGLIPDCGSTFTLPRLIGFHRALSHMMLGDKITALEALNSGLVYKLYSAGEFPEECVNFAKNVGAMPTKALSLTKHLLNRSLSNNLEEQLRLESETQGMAGKTADFMEGVTAFLEKREPNFKGK